MDFSLKPFSLFQGEPIMNISLGPAPLHWGKEKLTQFYQEVAEAPLNTVFIGEVFCEKRNTLSEEELEEFLMLLLKKGKEVYFSTGTLITNGIQWERLRKRCEIFQGIEANTVGILDYFQGKRKIVAGPFLNLYNHRSIQFLEKCGIAGVVLPCELPHHSVKSIVKEVKAPVEVVAYGNLPLGVSWRCYLARAFGRGVERCQFTCRDYPQGIEAETIDGMPLFIVNGPYIQSAYSRCLIGELEYLKAIGVASIRIMPQYEHTSEIVKIFRDTMEYRVSAQDAFEQLASFSGSPLTNGWFHGEAGWKYVKEDQGCSVKESKNYLSPHHNIC